MADIIVFHHAQGLTDGVRAFADTLRDAGHRVTVPDLYEGATFATLEEGIDHADEVGFGVVIERALAAVDELPSALVYIGFSLGVLPAQSLVQNRPGARGGVFFHSAVSPADMGEPWPAGVPAQIHAMEDDELFVEEGDLDAARELARIDGVELYLYDGDAHLFMDASLAEYDETAAALATQRVLDFVASLG